MLEEQLAWYRGNVRAEWQLITPAKAEKMLKRNVNNYRTINKKTVSDYAKEMADGSWQANGETIVFDEEGHLTNGQHRLSAIVKSNREIICLVVYGMPKTVDLYDFQKRRSMADRLKAEGCERANHGIVAAANSIVWAFKTGTEVNRNSTRTIEYVKNNYEGLVKAYEICNTGTNHNICKVSAIVACVFCLLMTENDEQGVRNLMKITNTGLPIENVNSYPGLTLRKVIMESRGGGGHEMRLSLLFDATYQAYMDQKRNVKRTKKYTYSGKSEMMLATVRNGGLA